MAAVMDEEDLVPLSQAMHATADLGSPPGDVLLQQPQKGIEQGTLKDMPSSQLEEKGRHGKVFNDPVHKHVYVSPTGVKFVDSREFQRLRRLKQLGCTYHVFPGASHNRFEHSIGVGHLAWQLGQKLGKAQALEGFPMERNDVLALEVAGLCHDLGHGPYSHVFDRELLKRRGITDWEHEHMSCKLLDHIIDTNSIETLREDDIRRIKAYITCEKEPPRSYADRRWMFEVVSNWRNSLDVDKFDYLVRDAMCCRLPIGCDVDRLLTFTRVIDDQVCWKYSEYETVHDVYSHRAKMHRRVYTHRKCKSVEFMVVDALLEADRCLGLLDRRNDVAEFVKLDDTVLTLISNFDLAVPGYEEREEYAPIVAANKIIHRIETRNLYKYCNEILVPPERVERGRWALPDVAEVAAEGNSLGVAIRPEDLILNEVKVDFAMKDKNPLDQVSFFRDFGALECFKLRGDQVTNMVNSSFQDVKLRIYSKNSDPTYCRAVEQAFLRFTRRTFGSAAHLGTPMRVSGSADDEAAAAAAYGARGSGRNGAGGDGGAGGGAGTGGKSGAPPSGRGRAAKRVRKSLDFDPIEEEGAGQA